MIKFAVLATLGSVFLTFAIVSVVADLTKRSLFLLCLLFLLGAALYYFSLSHVYASITIWLAATSWRIAVLLGLLLGMFAATLMVVRILRMKKVLRLEWPASLDQLQMQSVGAFYLQKHGWSVTRETGFANIDILRCRKAELRMFAVFVRDNISFERLISNLQRSGLPIQNFLIILYGGASSILDDYTRSGQPVFINYSNLKTVDACCRAMEARRLARRTTLNKA